MVKKKNIDFMEEIENEFGEFLTPKEDNGNIDVISTGALSLDISTGIGGIPRGRFTEIYGSEGGGKTTLALGICEEALKLGHQVLYLDPEQAVDEESMLGESFDKNKFMLVRTETMEQTLNIAEIGIRSNEFELIVLDSIGSLSPKKVKEDELTDANVALLARIMTTWVQRNAFDLKKNNVAFVGVNQVRDKIGSYYGGFETPGGHAWKHILSLRVQLSRISDIEKTVDGKKEKLGIYTKFIIKKNKLAPPYRTFTFPIMFGSGIDSIRDIVEFATVVGVLSKGGSYYKFEGETLAMGMVKTIEHLKENGEVLDKIVNMCYNSFNIKLEKDKKDESEV